MTLEKISDGRQGSRWYVVLKKKNKMHISQMAMYESAVCVSVIFFMIKRITNFIAFIKKCPLFCHTTYKKMGE